MKIDNSVKPAVAPPSGRIKTQQNSGASNSVASKDDVKLSSLAEQLHSGDAQPPVDSARVEEIKRAIAEGRFSINANAIADRLIDSARQLVDFQRRA